MFGPPPSKKISARPNEEIISSLTNLIPKRERERERETRVERETEEGGHQPPAIDSPPFAAVVPPAAHPTSDADLSNPNKYIFSPTKPNTDMIFLWFSFSVLYVYNLCEYVIVEFFFFFWLRMNVNWVCDCESVIVFVSSLCLRDW